ncbi:hypothetical protein V490_06487, partial [Pseudogymnoascus sp. VKM F-3557]
LITGATLKKGGERACIALGQEGLVDAEPVAEGVEGLRRWAERERRMGTKKQEVSSEVLEKLERTVGEAGLYTLAELNERVHEEEGAWTVWLSLVVGQVNIVRIVRRGMAGVGECCGIPIYSLEPTSPCLTCGTVQKLSINPAVIGSLMDETGALEAEKLQWTPKTWEEFFGETGAMAILGGEKGADETREINEHTVSGKQYLFLDTEFVFSTQQRPTYTMSRMASWICAKWPYNTDALCFGVSSSAVLTSLPSYAALIDPALNGTESPS